VVLRFLCLINFSPYLALNEDMTDDEITEIIKNTPAEIYDGFIDFFGMLHVEYCLSSREKHGRMIVRVNALFRMLNLELADKVMVDRLGNLYLFGKPVNEEMTDDEIIKIINDTSPDVYDGFVNMEGTWITRDCGDC